MEMLQPDLIREILIRVPVTTLAAAAQHVCKLWQVLIRDPSFVRAHVFASDPGFLLRYRSCRPLDSRQFFVHASASKRHEINIEECEATSIDLQLPDSPFIYQSCDGLLLIEHQQEFLLCNPLLGEETLLPPNESDEELCWLVGFGYDSSADLYKVFRVNYPRFLQQSFVVDPVHLRLVCDVCTFRATTGPISGWRRVGYVSHRPVFGSSGVVVNGKLHWITAPSNEGEATGILSLDIRSETFAFIEPPSPSLQTIFAFEMKGHLAVYGKHQTDDGMTGEIWVLQVYGRVESWTKACAGTWLLCRDIIPMSSCMDLGGLMYHSIRREVGSQCGNPYYYYDFQTRTCRNARMPEFDGCKVVNLIRYTPSLVSLQSESRDMELKSENEGSHFRIAQLSL